MPAASVLMVIVATPPDDNVPVPSTALVLASENCTLPAGVPFVEVTVAVKVMARLRMLGLAELTSDVAVE